MKIKQYPYHSKIIKKSLRYYPYTGECVWIVKNKSHPRLFLRSAGSIDNEGRISITVAGKTFRRSRIAFLLMTGKWPNIVDHINGNPIDDRWFNLRSVTHRENAENISVHKRKKRSGLPVGVKSLNKGRSFEARITVNKNLISLGYFPSPCLAHAAYIKAKFKYHGVSR